MILELPRRFHLRRMKDDTGVSGTGVVAQGVRFMDGTVVVRWLGTLASTNCYDTSPFRWLTDCSMTTCKID